MQLLYIKILNYTKSETFYIDLTPLNIDRIILITENKQILWIN